MFDFYFNIKGLFLAKFSSHGWVECGSYNLEGELLKTSKLHKEA